MWVFSAGDLRAPDRFHRFGFPRLGKAVFGEQPSDMIAVQIDVRADPAKTVCAFRFEGQGLALCEKGFGAGFDFLTERVLFRAARAVAGLWAIPPDQTQANAFRGALQFERVTIDGEDIAHRGADTARARDVAEIVGFWGRVVASAAYEEKEGEDRRAKHEGRWPCLGPGVNCDDPSSRA